MRVQLGQLAGLVKEDVIGIGRFLGTMDGCMAVGIPKPHLLQMELFVGYPFVVKKKKLSKEKFRRNCLVRIVLRGPSWLTSCSKFTAHDAILFAFYSLRRIISVAAVLHGLQISRTESNFNYLQEGGTGAWCPTWGRSGLCYSI